MVFSDVPGIQGHSGKTATCNDRGELVAIHIAEVTSNKQSAGIHLDDVKEFMQRLKVGAQ